MRYPAGNAGRVHTFFPLVVLITLSFLVLFVQGSSSPELVVRHSRRFAVERSNIAPQVYQRDDSGGSGTGSASTTSSSSGSSKPTSASSSSSVSVSHSSSSSSSISVTTSQSSSSSSSFSASPTSLSSTSTSFSSSSTFSQTSTTTPTSSTSFVPATSSSTTFSPTTTSSTSSSSSSKSSSVKATTLSVSLASNEAEPSRTVASIIAGALTTSSSGSAAGTTVSDIASSPSATASGFLANTGAVAATFSIVGIVVVGIVVAIFIVIRRRRRSEELDIFDTEYKDYSSSGGHFGNSGGGDRYVSDTSSLSANAVSSAGAPGGGGDSGHTDYGIGLPPMVGLDSNRSSVASNHAGFGAFRSATESRKPPVQSSALRNEVPWLSDTAYGEPAVGEDESIYIVPASQQGHSSFYAAQQTPGYVGMAH